jgi:hypothetical protein
MIEKKQFDWKNVMGFNVAEKAEGGIVNLRQQAEF